MAKQTLRLYEAMFLVETNIATDFQATKSMIETIMERAQTQLLTCRLWDERRLAYDINKHGRAAYVLCYFRADGKTIGRIERDVQLSEHLLRVLVLRADYITDEQLEQIVNPPDSSAPSTDQDSPAGKSEDKPPEKQAEEASASPSETAADSSDSPDSADSGSPSETAADSASEPPPAQDSPPAETEEKPDAVEEKS